MPFFLYADFGAAKDFVEGLGQWRRERSVKPTSTARSDTLRMFAAMWTYVFVRPLTLVVEKSNAVRRVGRRMVKRGAERAVPKRRRMERVSRRYGLE